jgi:hypothetical protein
LRIDFVDQCLIHDEGCDVKTALGGVDVVDFAPASQLPTDNIKQAASRPRSEFHQYTAAGEPG